MKKVIILLALAISLSNCSYYKTVKLEKVEKLITTSIEDDQYSHIHWGIQIESMKSGEVIYKFNSNKLFIPASNQKLLTAASALVNLQPDYEIPTKFYYQGTIEDSILKGNLIIQGFGDPTFSRDFNDNPTEILSFWADSLKSHGIKYIDGDLIGDDNAFDENGFGKGWMLEDLKYPYAAEIGALQFNDNSIRLKIIPPDRENDPAAIIPEFKCSCFTLINEVTSIQDSLSWINIERPIYNNTIYVRGNVQPGGPVIFRLVTLTDPTNVFLSVLRQTFTNNGISLLGETYDCDDMADYHLDSLNTFKLFETRSIPLWEILKNMLDKSSNLQAETILKLIAANSGQTGSSENGKEIQEKFLSDLGIPTGTYRFADASGLSRYNLISPEQITTVLRFMLTSEYSDLWREIIPVTGRYSKESGLSIGKNIHGNIRAKTGTMSNIRCLSGYIFLPDDTLVFSFLTNSHLLSSLKIDLLTYTVLLYVIENMK